MDETKKYLSELHREHNDWEKALDFARDEISSFKNRLSEIVMANTKTEVLAQVEHFQNQFIRHNEVIDQLKHSIHAEEEKIAAIAQANNVATDRRKAKENMKLLDQMDSFDKLFSELKDEFKVFLTKVL